VAAIPLSILDAEDNGRSTPSALSMLSQPPDQMVSAWAGGRLNAPPSPEAPARLAANMAAAESIGLRGTPTLVWRKADGSEGRSDGMPSDLNAFVASLGR
jgi:thiol:disulfide interchange protein DsbG